MNHLVDLVSGQAPASLAVHWPFIRYVFEPLAGAGEYVLSFSRYIVQLLSWVCWLPVIFSLRGFFQKKTAGEIVRGITFSWLFILTAVVFALIMPLAPPALLHSKSQSVIDFHSHTYYSHDGVDTPAESVKYHSKLGFDAFFITEHNNTVSFSHFPQLSKFKKVLPGMQISTTEKISLVVLADRVIDGDLFQNKTIREVIDLAHGQKFVVICPHWWKWRYPAIEQLYEMGIDGFEVYNAGYRNFSDADRQRLIDFCKQKKLLMLGSTDWHGWGRISNVWTVFDRRTSDGIDPSELFKDLRDHAQSKVIVYGKAEKNDLLRYIFEPFFGAYYYVTGLNLQKLLVWIIWAVVFYRAIKSLTPRRFLCILSYIIGISIVIMSVHFWFKFRPVMAGNDVFKGLFMPILIFLSLAWFIFAKLFGRMKQPS